MKKYVLIVAGGKGLRMGGDLPKQFIPIEGKPLLMHTLETFHRWDASAGIILVLPEDHQPYWKMLCREIGCRVPHQLVTGGETRFHSVRNGLAFLAHTCALPAGEPEIKQTPGPQTAGPQTQPATGPELPEPFYIAVHDGVRPFVAPSVITACFKEAIRSGAAIPVVPMIDSLRESDENGSHPVDRSRYFAVQTPQVFDGHLLLQAYAGPCHPSFTDDASVVEALGVPIRMVEGNRENIKITTPFDLVIAGALLRRRD